MRSLVLDVNRPLSPVVIRKCKLLNIWSLVTIVPDCFAAFDLFKFVPGGGLGLNGIWSRLFGRDVIHVMKKVILTKKTSVPIAIARASEVPAQRVPTHAH